MRAALLMTLLVSGLSLSEEPPTVTVRMAVTHADIEVLSGGRVRTREGESMLEGVLAWLSATNERPTTLSIWADSSVPYGEVQRVIEGLQAIGISQVTMKDEPESVGIPYAIAGSTWVVAVPPPSLERVRLRIAREPSGGVRFSMSAEWTGRDAEAVLALLSGAPWDKPPCPVTLDVADGTLPYSMVCQAMKALTDRGFTDIQINCPRDEDAVVRVYAADDTPRWEWRYLRSLLARMKGVDLDDHLRSADEDYPQDPWIEGCKLDDYDLIVLGDVEVSAELAERLAAWVKDGGGLVLLAGERHMPLCLRGTALEAALPCELPAEERAWTQNEGPAMLEFTDEGRRLFDGPRTPIPDGQPVWWNGEGTHAYLPLSLSTAGRPLATIQGHPDCVAFGVVSFGKGIVFQSNLDETWRWRSMDPAPHASFWKTVVRLVARRGAK